MGRTYRTAGRLGFLERADLDPVGCACGCCTAQGADRTYTLSPLSNGNSWWWAATASANPEANYVGDQNVAIRRECPRSAEANRGRLR